MSVAVKTLPREVIQSKICSLKKSRETEEEEMGGREGVSLLGKTNNELPVMCKTLITLTLTQYPHPNQINDTLRQMYLHYKRSMWPPP